MKNLVRLGNVTVSKDFPSVEVLKNAVKLNTLAVLKLGAVPGESRIDVAVDGKGAGAEVFITCLKTSDEKVGRQLSKTCTFNSSSIKAALEQFKAEVFEITDEATEFEGETWYKIVTRKDQQISARGKAKVNSSIEEDAVV